MADLGSLLDRSREAISSVVGKAAGKAGIDHLGSVAGLGAGAAMDDGTGMSQSLLPRGLMSDMDLDMVLPSATARMSDWTNIMFWIVALVVCFIIGEFSPSYRNRHHQASIRTLREHND